MKKKQYRKAFFIEDGDGCEFVLNGTLELIPFILMNQLHNDKGERMTLWHISRMILGNSPMKLINQETEEVYYLTEIQ